MRIVVGGLARKTGKTTLVCRIIALTPGMRWTAVKISHHPPAGGAPFEIVEESAAGPEGDTCRYLAAGAARAYWLRGDLTAGLGALRALLSQPANWIVESTRAARLLEHDFAFLVVAPDRVDDGKLLDLLAPGGQQHGESDPPVIDR